jgi:hypothetical protein
MRIVQDVSFDVTGQSIYFDAPEGRPSSVTSASVYLWDVPDDDIAETAIGTPTVETSPATTVDAASGYGQSDPRLVNVAATTGFAVDRSYLVTGADGFKEWFDCAEIDSGNSVTARHPLHNTYATADTVQSTRITAAIDSTWVADLTNITSEDVGPNPMYRVRWVYVVAGVTYVADTYFNLVRYPARHGVLPADVEATQPGWLDRLPSDHRNDQGRRLINEAHRSVTLDLHQVDLAMSSIAESSIVDELVRLKTVALGESARFYDGSGSAEMVQFAKAEYAQRLDALLRIASRVPVRAESGAATPVFSVPAWRR